MREWLDRYEAVVEMERRFRHDDVVGMAANLVAFFANFFVAVYVVGYPWAWVNFAVALALAFLTRRYVCTVARRRQVFERMDRSAAPVAEYLRAIDVATKYEEARERELRGY